MSNIAPPWSEIRLRPLDMLDLEEVRAWQNDPEIRDRTMGFRFPVQKSGVAAWVEAARQREGRDGATFSVFAGDVGVGVAMLRQIDWLNRNADLGIYIAAPGAAGKGTGFVACVLLLDYAFSGLGLNRIGLEVAAFNVPAIRLYERLGFQREGVLRRKYFVSGRREDVIVFGLLAEDFSITVPETAHRLISTL
jgi:UDP-4-amino-4,6-dideoxy-N-acetyl-beta-L-altrosamine N-acetyltransferase